MVRGMAGATNKQLVSKAAIDDYGSGPSAEWLAINWREHLRQLEVNGRTINYIDIKNDKSDRAPLLFVHGVAGCWQNWLENIPYFSRSRRVIALDLPGFGQSEMPAERITIPGLNRALDIFCEKVGAGLVDLVGHSMGGLIASNFAADHPERVRRLALVSAAGVSATNLARLPRIPGRRIGMIVGEFFKSHREELVRRRRIRWLALSGVARYPDRIRPELLYEMSNGFGAPGFWDAINAMMNHNLRPKLERIQSPTLIVWGRSDRIIPVRIANIFEKLIPVSQKVIFDETGHSSMFERPARFNRLLDEFLSKQDLPALPTSS